MTAGVGLNVEIAWPRPQPGDVLVWVFVFVYYVLFPPVDVQPVFKCVYIWGIPDWIRELIPYFGNPYSEGLFSNVQL